MQVFKSFFKIIKVHKVGVIIYTAIILVMLVVMSKTGTGNENLFEQEGFDIMIADEDDTEISKGLTEYLLSIHNEKEGDFSEDQITDMLYYRSVLAYIIIPKGFAEDVQAGRTPQIKLRTDQTLPVGNYVENQINAYITHLSDYLVLGESFEQANEKALVAADYARLVTMETKKSASGNTLSNINVILFAAFSVMGILLSGLLPVLFKFKQEGVYERTAVSSYRPEKRILALSLGTIVFSLAVFALLSVLLITLAGGEYGTGEMVLYLLNLFTFTVVISLLAIMIVQLPLSGSDSQVGMITNVVSLALSFLGGIFVPLSVLGEGVKSFARFLPTYWYATAVEKIGDGAATTDILSCMLIELFFGVACAVVGIVIARLSENKKIRIAKNEA